MTDRPQHSAVIEPVRRPVPAPAEHPAPAPPRVFLPGEFQDDLDYPRSAPATSWADRLGRPLLYGAAAVVAVVGAVVAYTLLPASRTASPASPGAVAPTPLALLDARSDTVELAVAAFNLRGGLFGRRQMSCADLARGLVQVDEAWLAYSEARRQGSPALDAARAERDNRLFAAVADVERRYQRTGCERP